MILPWYILNLEAAAPPVVLNGPTHYHVYANEGDGGPIDYSTPVATIDGLEWTPPPLTFPGAHRFGVRAFGSLSGLEERNVDAAVFIILEDAGKDITNRPAAPFGLRVRCESGGVVVTEWSHPGGARENRPTGFHVYTGWPEPNHDAPAATVAASAEFAGSHMARLAGLPDGPLAVAVRAFNAAAEEDNQSFVTVMVDGTPPGPVDGLTAQATDEATP